jgi:hypothetical protein
MDRLRKWYYERRFITAYRILRNASERHRVKGHAVHFRAINEAYVLLECVDCPDFRIPRSLDQQMGDLNDGSD